MTKTKQSLTEGPIFFRLILFTLPIMASGLLQTFYNMADNIIVGSYSGDDLALAAVGSTSTMTTLIVKLLLGFATGTGVVIAQAYGAKNKERLEKGIHTAMTFALIGGIVLAALGFIFSEWLFTLIGTKEELLSRALLYFRIICFGIPALTIYNFGSSILRSVGDSKTPLYILSFSGLLNVLLNLLFVLVFKMTVDGVAYATIASQYLSAIAVVILLMKRKEEATALKLKKLRIHKLLLLNIILLGLPTGIQSAVFSLANTFITSAVNTLPTTSVAANTIAGNIDTIVHTAMESFMFSAMTFVGQNYGARNFRRIKKTCIYAILQVMSVGLLSGYTVLFFGRSIASLFISSTDVNREIILDTTLDVMNFILPIYFLCGIMVLLSGLHRGLGSSIVPMVIGIVGVCGVRLVWIFFFFPMERFHTLRGLYISWPLTWIFCIFFSLIAFIITYIKIKKKFSAEEKEAAKINAE